VQVDCRDRITGFEEKPKQPTTIPGNSEKIYASMGIYVFSARVLFEELLSDTRSKGAHDFGKEVIPGMVGRLSLSAYKFANPNPGHEAYWRDIGTLDAYYRANMDLISVDPLFDLYDENWRVRTYQPQHPPTRLVLADGGSGARKGEALDSIVSGGCQISGGSVIRSVLSPRVQIESQARIEESVLLEGVVVGRGARIRNAVIDKFVAIPAGTTIGYEGEEDSRRFFVTPSGIVVVEKRMTIETDSDLVRGQGDVRHRQQPSFQAPFASSSRPQIQL
jgi:glucose-1-phosphate adenylyltransferase